MRANTFSNMYIPTFAIWIATPGEGLRDTLVNASAYVDGFYLGVAYTNVTLTGTLTSGTATAGDYLILEVGTKIDFTNTDSFDVEIGDTNSTNRMYFAFTDTITFQSPGTLSYSGAATNNRYEVRKTAVNLTASNTGSAIDSYAVNSGSLPTGVSLNTSTGAITGTPTQVGTYQAVIRGTNEGGDADATVDFVVYSGESWILNKSLFISTEID